MKTLTILIIFLMAACGGGASTDSSLSADYEAAPMTRMEGADEADYNSSTARKVSQSDDEGAEKIQKKVIKTGGLSYQVESTKEEYARLTNLIEQYKAYIASENESKVYDRINYNISIKVPPENFDPIIGVITEGKRVENKWVSSDDVTDRYYDLKSRIENKKKLEERYQEILKKATSIKDILEVERNLNQVRGEIESLQGQFKLLSHKIKYSTIDLSFYELIPYELSQEPRPGFGTRLLNSLSAGWQGFLTFLVYILALWPFGLVAIGVVWIVRRVRAKSKSE